MQRNLNRKRFVRYKEGAELYSMCQSKFEKMAKEANAIYKVDKLVLVNCDILKNIWKHSDYLHKKGFCTTKMFDFLCDKKYNNYKL